jgi:microcystin-dependent protein
MDPFVAEIKMFGCNFAPTGWAQCNGQLLPISQNTALFSLLGTTYGGDGKSTFALPDMQGNAGLQPGQGQGLSLYDLGQIGGEQNVTLLITEMPQHNHTAKGNGGDGQLPTPGTNTWAGPGAERGLNWYNDLTTSPNTAIMSPQALSVTGSSLPHNNMMPYNVVNFCIALQGVFPARN